MTFKQIVMKVNLLTVTGQIQKVAKKFQCICLERFRKLSLDNTKHGCFNQSISVD